MTSQAGISPGIGEIDSHRDTIHVAVITEGRRVKETSSYGLGISTALIQAGITAI